MQIGIDARAALSNNKSRRNKMKLTKHLLQNERIKHSVLLVFAPEPKVVSLFLRDFDDE